MPPMLVDDVGSDICQAPTSSSPPPRPIWKLKVPSRIRRNTQPPPAAPYPSAFPNPAPRQSLTMAALAANQPAGRHTCQRWPLLGADGGVTLNARQVQGR
jgi:hypothetical protein